MYKFANSVQKLGDPPGMGSPGATLHFSRVEGMRHILWAVAWMGLGLLITLAAANVLQGVATAPPRDPAVAPSVTPPSPALPAPRPRPAEPGRSVVFVSRGSALDQ